MAPYPLSHYALLTQRKLNKYTKQEELYARHRPDSMAGTTHAGLGQSESQRLFATCAEKEKEKMIHSKQTTLYPQKQEAKQSFFQLIEAVIDEEAINP